MLTVDELFNQILASRKQFLEPGQRRWEIHRTLGGPGKSGMGIVYIVLDHEHRGVYAAKTFQDEVFARDPGTAQRFEQEARTWINLDIHQNITQARFIETIHGKPYLFLEYVSAGDLGSWIGTPRLTQDLPKVLHFSIQFCDGMIHALSKGVMVHRDVKPENCLVTQDGTLKVTDFGLAKALEGASLTNADGPSVAAGRLSLGTTRTGVGAGTPTHMAPEQFDDAKRVDIRADIYSLGVMIYQMVAGQLPFVGRTWEEVARLHKTKEPPSLDRQSPEIAAVVRRCLAKNPVNRFSDFVTVRAELAGIYQKLVGNPVAQPVAGKELDGIEWSNKGASLAKLGSYEDALACCDRAIDLNPHYVEAWNNKGVTLGLFGRSEEAVACYDRALELNPRYDGAWNNKGGVLTQLGRSEEAVVCCDRAIELNPHNVEAWYNKGNALNALGRSKEAVLCCDRAIELNPRSEAAWNSRGNALYELGQHEEAVVCYGRALEHNPLDEKMWANKGIALDELGRSEEAIACYDRALENNPLLEGVWFRKAGAIGKLGQSQEAIACYDRAIELNPRFEEAWYSKGAALDNLGRSEEAVVCCDRAIELNPRSAESWFNKGVPLYALGRREEAVACYNRAIELNPRLEQAWSNQGIALSELGRSEEAVACYNRVLELNPRYEKAWCNRGAVLHALERYEDAVASYDRAIELNPRDEKVWYNKGVALVTGFELYREALLCFEEAHRLGFSQAASAITQLRQILGK